MMTRKDDSVENPSELRERAEKIAGEKAVKSPEDIEEFSPQKMREALHELRVHKIELEMQNETLRMAQEELETTRKLYFDLYDLAPVGYCIVSEKGMILKANLTTAALLNRARSELINKPVSLFIVYNDQDIYYHNRKKLFETREAQIFELRMRRADNLPFWARVDASIAEYKGEAPVCQFVFSDISEAKRTEHDLTERIKELNFFFSLSDLLEEPDIRLDELLQKTVMLIPPAWQFPEIAEACIELEGRAIQTERFRKTKWMQTSDIALHGKTIGKVSVSYSEKLQSFDQEPFLNEEGRLLTFIAKRIGQIIERFQMTAAVKQSEAFLGTAINAITNPFAVINTMDYTIDIANKAYGGDDVTGMKCYTVSHQRDMPCAGTDYPCAVLEVKRTGEPFAGEHIYDEGQGTPLIMETHAYPVFDRNGQVVQVIKYQIDITMRKQVDMALKQKAAELEDMNTALKVLLKKREQDKDDIEEKIFANYQLVLTPVIHDLEKTLTLEKQQDMMTILKTDLHNILSPFSRKLSDKMINLTPREIHVANLIKSGKSNKEMAQILNCSFNTIARHRDNIRKKTGLKNKKTNLRSFLLTLQ